MYIFFICKADWSARDSSLLQLFTGQMSDGETQSELQQLCQDREPGLRHPGRRKEDRHQEGEGWRRIIRRKFGS